jgi:hypothetical protein
MSVGRYRQTGEAKMRKWGILVSVLYLAILLFLLDPLAAFIITDDEGLGAGLALRAVLAPDLADVTSRTFLMWVLILVAAQALFLFVSVDSSFRRLRPRRHIGVSVATVAIAVGLLSALAVFSVGVAFQGDEWLGGGERSWYRWFWGIVLVFWMVWGVVFYLYRKDAAGKLAAMTRWLITGSILELLVAVPCHVIVRSRGDCSAPVATAYGIATGIAVMLLAFGPAVLFLYQERLSRYRKESAAE